MSALDQPTIFKPCFGQIHSDIFSVPSEGRFGGNFREIIRDPLADLGMADPQTSVPSQEIRSSFALWKRMARDRGYDIELQIGGSLASGLFKGPKPRQHSSNKRCPEGFDRIVECDGRILLKSVPNGVSLSPHDPRVVRDFSEILRAQNSLPPERANRWGRDTEVSRIYTYRDLGKGTGLEFEMCIVPSYFVELATYWRFVFTEEEREQQSFFRAALRGLGAEKKDVTSEKEPETVECRWRVISAYALTKLFSSGQLDIFNEVLKSDGVRQIRSELSSGPFSRKPPQLLEPLVGDWIQGKSDKPGLFRPDPEQKSPAPVVREMVGGLWPETITPVREPAFVRFAEIVHDALKKAHAMSNR